MVTMPMLIGQGIDFNAANFTAAMTKAKAEKKLIFVDAYTTWCGPCKHMSAKVFTDSEVGAYFNDYFVNVKIDMEQGEGPNLAKAWEIRGYPTLIFLNGDGEVIHRSMGARPAADFLDLGKAANDPDRQITTMTRRYEAGERSADFLRKYTDAMTSAGLKGFGKIAQQYMDTQSDWTTKDNMQFIFDYADASMDSKLFQYSMEHKAAFRDMVGAKKWDQKIAFAAEQDRTKNGIARDNVDGLKAHFSKYFETEKADQMAMMSYFRQLMYSPDPVEQEKFKAEIQLFLADEPDLGWNFYNATAWQLFEVTTDRDLLKKAKRWTTISMQDQKNSYNTDTHAWILHKLGDTKKAIAYAQESIQLAKAEGSDYSATQKLLDSMR